MDRHTSFGQWLKQRRNMLDLTRDDLAQKVGCSPETLHKIEGGARRPSKQIAGRLADALEISPGAREAFIRFARQQALGDQVNEAAVEVESAVNTGMPLSRDRPDEHGQRPRPTNLPAPLTTLIARQQEVAQIWGSFMRDAARLLTLTGPPGIGKTRVGLKVAADLHGEARFKDGVFLVELAPIRDPLLVTHAIARTLGVKDDAGRPRVEQLSQYLRDKEMLLMLDNFEQVLEAAPIVVQLLERAPGLDVLVTSRVALQVYGEHEFAVPPLGLPDLRHLPDAEQLARYPAVALFRARARAVNPSFEVTEANAAAVAHICARLDRLPLAIELAAGQIRRFPPDELAAQIGRRLDLLLGGARNLPARQQTLRGAIEWSYELLDEAERTLFARLAVFAGGCTMEAAEAVCASVTLESPNLVASIVDGMLSLRDKHLLRQIEQCDGEPRFGMLETIRDYALERLESSGEAAEIALRHLAFYLALAEAAAPELIGRDQAMWLERLDREHDNLALALQTAIELRQVEIAARLAAALWRFWWMRGYLTEGRRWLAQVLGLLGAGGSSGEPEAVTGSPPRTKTWATVLRGAGLLAKEQGDYMAARTLYEQSLAILRELDDRMGITALLNAMGILAYEQADYAGARLRHEESLAMRRACGDAAGIADSLINLANIAYDQGDYTTARALNEEGLAFFQEQGDQSGIAIALANLGLAACALGDFVTGRTLLEKGLAIEQALGNKWGIADSLHDLGDLALYECDHATAWGLYEESLAIRRDVGDRTGIAATLNNQGRAAFEQGDYGRARALYKQGLALRQELDDKRGIASSLDSFAGLAAAHADWERALRLASVAAALREAICAPLPPHEQALHERQMAAARAALGETASAVAWAAGQHMTIEEAIDAALASFIDRPAPRGA